MRKLKRNQKILKPDHRLLEACQQLRHFIEHPNERPEIIEQQGIYKHKDPAAIMTVQVDGIVVGYKVKPSSPLELSPYFERYVYVSVPGNRIGDLSKQEAQAIMMAIAEAFFEPQQGGIKEIPGLNPSTMGFYQRFMVAFPVQRAPGLVTIAGGFDA